MKHPYNCPCDYHARERERYWRQKARPAGTKTCPECGDEFGPRGSSLVGWHKAIYCSARCRQRANRRRPHRRAHAREAKRRALQRVLGRECQDCLIRDDETTNWGQLKHRCNTCETFLRRARKRPACPECKRSWRHASPHCPYCYPERFVRVILLAPDGSDRERAIYRSDQWAWERLGVLLKRGDTHVRTATPEEWRKWR